MTSMKRVHIFVEGPNDIHFLAWLFSHPPFDSLGIEKDKVKGTYFFPNGSKITALLGKDLLFSNGTQEELKANTDDGITNIVILDADTPKQDAINGGFHLRKEYIDKEKARLGLDFIYFLLPNNIDDGMLEVLQKSIFNNTYGPLISCIDDTKKCIAAHTQDPKIIDNLEHPKKAFPIIKAFLGISIDKNHDQYLDYNSKSLIPLVQFLESNIINKP